MLCQEIITNGIKIARGIQKMTITINKQKNMIGFKISHKVRMKEVEKTLYNYKNFGLEIESLDIHINSIINDVGIAGVSYGERSSPTNAFSSSVESEVIKREKLLEILQSKKQRLIELDRLIKVALTSLEPEELKLVELRYFSKPKKSWIEIGMTLGIDKSTCCRFNRRILNKLDQFLISFSSLSCDFSAAFIG